MGRERPRFALGLTLLLILIVQLATPAGAETSTRHSVTRGQAAIDSGIVHPRVASTLSHRGSVDALLTFAYRDVLARAKRSADDLRPRARSAAILSQTRPVYAAEKQMVLGDVDGAEVLRDYDALPVSFVRFSSADALAEVASSPDVVSVMPNDHATAQLTESLPLIHQPQAQARGYTGAGTAVAVLDTGVWYTSSVFGSCTSPGVPAGCKVPFAQDFAINDWRLDVDPWHGSNVAGAVLGVAPSTKILALDVFRGEYAYWDDVIAAVNWAVSTQSTYNTRAMNLSFGTSEFYTSECSASALTAPFAAARAVGVLPVAASGNAAYSGYSFHTGVASPACAPGAVRVGSVYDSAMGAKYLKWCTDAATATDQVVCSSQTGPLLTLLAPGSVIVAVGISMSGTSQAAPHVAGAAAVLAAAAPAATPTQITNAMRTSGDSVWDPRVSQSYPRLDLDAAIDGLTSGFPELSATLSGSGNITTWPTGMSCPGVCSYRYASGTQVQVGAVASTGWHFTGWSGACTGTANPCTVSMTQARNITASFAPDVPYPTLSLAVAGSGLVTSSPNGIYCPGVCAATFSHGTSVQLTAAPSNGWSFTGWSGACTGTTVPCTVSMTQGRNVTATFAQDPLEYPLSVATSGSGSVSSTPSGISCPGTCGATYASGTSVSLTAAPSPGWSFSWGGSCSGSVNPCTVSMTQARSVTAIFTQDPKYPLSVAVNGSGSVSSNPDGISCPDACKADYVQGSSVSLKAAPSVGWYFSGWSGACTGPANICTVSMTQARNATATFKAYTSRYALSIGITGYGGVTSDPKGIYCPDICETDFDKGTDVSLTATPSAGWSFAGWDGACTGSENPCVVPMTESQKVAATFTEGPTQRPLTVDVKGWGIVTSDPKGIYCPDACEAGFDDGANVELTATPESGWSFAGWEGACTGTANPCVVAMTESRNASAVFTQNAIRYPLRVALTGSGKISSTPDGILCPDDCEADFDEGTLVQLTADPRSGWWFSWEGACSGSSNPCVVTMSQAQKVGAVFTRTETYPLLVSIEGPGSISSEPKGIECPGTCEAEFGAKTEVQLTAMPQAGWWFTWEGACTGSANPCVVPMSEAQKVGAVFSEDVKPYPLWVTVEGSGGVSSDPAGIACPGTSCDANYGEGTNVALTASPGDGWLFAGWGGACAGSASTCTVPMDAEQKVAATFTQAGTATTTSGTLSGSYRTRNGNHLYRVRSRALYEMTVSPAIPGATVTTELWKWNKNASTWVLVWVRNSTLDPAGRATLRVRGKVHGRGWYSVLSSFPGDATHLASGSASSYLKFTR